MSSHATVSAAHGRFVLPTETAYDRELFGEFVRYAARRKEQLELTVGSCTWLVGVRDGMGSCLRRAAAAARRWIR
jgi:hypothetical protein